MRSILATAFLLLTISTPAQTLSDEEPVLLPDAVMQQVVSRIIRWNFKPGRSPRTVPVADLGIKREWLPEISNVTFDLVAERDVMSYEKSVFLVQDIKRDGQAYLINAGWGDLSCNASGETWKFTVRAGKVRLWRTEMGWGMGCIGNTPPPVRGLKVGDVSRNELRGYEFFATGKLKHIRLGLSTREDMKRHFGNTCEGHCAYDENWDVWVNYFDDKPHKQTITTNGQAFEIELVAKPQFVGTLRFVNLIPKKRISFLRVLFPRNFVAGRNFSIGDAWGVNGFEGAVHTTSNVYTDGYGLSYHLYGEETFNNLIETRKTVDKYLKGDLTSIRYEIPDVLDDTIYDKRSTLVTKN